MGTWNRTVGPAVSLTLLAGAAPAQPGSLYAVQRSSRELIRIDPGTGAETLVGAIGFDGVGCLAYAESTGFLYGYDEALNVLVRIDPRSAASSSMGNLAPLDPGALTEANLPSLAYVPGGPGCPGDLDGSGTLNLDDLDAFIEVFLAGCG